MGVGDVIHTRYGRTEVRTTDGRSFVSPVFSDEADRVSRSWYKDGEELDTVPGSAKRHIAKEYEKN